MYFVLIYLTYLELWDGFEIKGHFRFCYLMNEIIILFHFEVQSK